MNLNLSASFNVLRLLSKPSLCLPHATVATFNDLPIPLDRAFGVDGKRPRIQAVVLDKDDCFAYPNTAQVHPPYKVRWGLPFRPLSVALLPFVPYRRVIPPLHKRAKGRRNTLKH